MPPILAFLLALAACSPAIRATGRCPTAPALATDFALGATLAASAVLAYAESPDRAFVLSTAALGIWTLANMSECR